MRGEPLRLSAHEPNRVIERRLRGAMEFINRLMQPPLPADHFKRTFIDSNKIPG